ncbi:hypothetical protein [Erythrobacter sp. QSSC1-22B]|uniref:hypothetical protein n=1 Tax=Erythrobacter sp. QSSC1-22B TaxID=1860125 RepID=UPI001F2AEE8E|nr:hypothetical protein [Erythrobacter sp. QSSC1-22B]
MSASTGRLTEFLNSLSQAEQDRWDSLTPSRRRDAVKRFDLFELWAKGELSADEAIRRFGKSPSRFYRLAAQWREKPNLDALGVGIRAPRSKTRQVPEIVNALQAKVAEVVRLNADASVSRQATLLLEAAGFGSKKPIGTTALRKIIETERWRVDATGRVGHQICLDCTAINLPRSNRRPYILYVIIDAGTGIVLGFSFGATVDVLSGYTAAASDALTWIERNTSKLPWAPKLTQTIFVSGQDGDASKELVEWMIKEEVGGNVLRASASRRFGSQFRKIIGERLGRVQITPARTLEGEALPDNGIMTPWTDTEVEDELRRTFDDHNASVIFNFTQSLDSTTPVSLLKFLEELARARRSILGSP